MNASNDGPTPPAPDIDPMTLGRFLSGESSAEERSRVERWIEASAENQALVETMRAAWARPPAAEFDPDDAVWARIRDQIDAPRARPALVAEPGANERRDRPFQLTRRRSGWIAAAAVVALVAAGGLVARRALEPAGLATGAPVATREVATRRGERTVLNLADGSRVVLGPESRLRVPAEIGTRAGEPRDLYLDGEAYFQVVHDSTRPFRVHTAAGVAEDIGTEYVVTTYPEVRGMRVVVASGTVALRQAATPPRAGNASPGIVAERTLATLTQGDLATMDFAGAATLKRHVDVAPYVAWARGTLVFDGTRLSDAVPALARWYDVEIHLADPSLADLKLTATFRDEPLSQVLELMGMSLDLAVKRQGHTVTLAPSRSK